MLENRPQPFSLLRDLTGAVGRNADGALVRYPWWERRKFLVAVSVTASSVWIEWSANTSASTSEEVVRDVPLEPVPEASVETETDTLPKFPPEGGASINPFGISVSSAYNAASDTWEQFKFASAQIVPSALLFHRVDWVSVKTVNGVSVNRFLGLGVVVSTAGDTLAVAYFATPDGGRVAADAEALLLVEVQMTGERRQCYASELFFAAQEFAAEPVGYSLTARRSVFESLMKANVPQMTKVTTTTVDEVEYGDQD